MIDDLGGWSINSVGQRYGNGYSVKQILLSLGGKVSGLWDLDIGASLIDLDIK